MDEQKKVLKTTTFQLPITLYNDLKMMCVLTGTSMGTFIRISIRDKIKNLKENQK